MLVPLPETAFPFKNFRDLAHTQAKRVPKAVENHSLDRGFRTHRVPSGERLTSPRDAEGRRHDGAGIGSGQAVPLQEVLPDRKPRAALMPVKTQRNGDPLWAGATQGCP